MKTFLQSVHKTGWRIEYQEKYQDLTTKTYFRKIHEA